MATHAARLIQDQNLDIHFPGGATLGGKTDGSKAQKKAALGARKALNDISNSAKPSALQASKKQNSSNLIPIEKDIGAAKTPFAVGGKSNGTKVPQKGKSGGRKALSDLTNSGNSSRQEVSKKSQDKKLGAILEENVPASIKEEGFLHDHQECIKAQNKVMDKESFLKLVGLFDGSPIRPPSSNLKPESPLKHMEMEEMPEPQLGDLVIKRGKDEFSGFYSPACGSPVSPKLPWANWKDDEFLDFTLIASPKLPKY